MRQRSYLTKELYDREHIAPRHICRLITSGFKETKKKKKDLAVKYEIASHSFLWHILEKKITKTTQLRMMKKFVTNMQ